MSADLATVAAAVQARVPYLGCATGAPEAEGWLRCSTVIDDPARLRREILATAIGRGTDDDQVAASLFVQSYAFRVPSIAVAAFALGLDVPTADPGQLAFRLDQARPAQLAVLSPWCRPVGADALAAELFDGHLGPLVAAVRAGITVGERLLWGNVASSLAVVFRAVHDDGHRLDPAVRDRATEFYAAAAPWIAGLGHWSLRSTSNPARSSAPSLEARAEAVGWHWNRTSCCLWYRTEGGFYCDDCSLHDQAELAARRRDQLGR